jgi:lipoyl(octanoyl) transferase
VIEVHDLGRVEYEEALTLQRELAEARKTGRSGRDLLLLVEHPPVITRGRRADPAHTLSDAAGVAAGGIRRVEVERGGDVTYHGPGQVVGYPILHLEGFRKDLHWYLRRIEEAIIRALGGFGIGGFRVAGLTGVWVGDPGAEIRKIASIGVHASRWVTTHGFALNHSTRALDGFRWIVPCGIPGVTMTSIEDEGVAVERADVLAALISGFGEAFGVEMVGADQGPSLATAKGRTDRFERGRSKGPE